MILYRGVSCFLIAGRNNSSKAKINKRVRRSTKSKKNKLEKENTKRRAIQYQGKETCKIPIAPTGIRKLPLPFTDELLGEQVTFVVSFSLFNLLCLFLRPNLEVIPHNFCFSPFPRSKSLSCAHIQSKGSQSALLEKWSVRGFVVI